MRCLSLSSGYRRDPVGVFFACGSYLVPTGIGAFCRDLFAVLRFYGAALS
jgi:hypothetical protein